MAAFATALAAAYTAAPMRGMKLCLLLFHNPGRLSLANTGAPFHW
jgi:hypothetical protein